MNTMRISFITTVYNEEKTIESFLDSILSQTHLPDEVVIVDALSSDSTISRIADYTMRFKKKKIQFTVLIKKGNRSVGRNEAIRYATGDIIACSDAGNILDKNWVKEIAKPFVDSRVSVKGGSVSGERENDKKEEKIDVVAGYYDGNAKTIFQKCLIPYVLVMPNQVNPKTFLPATRSVAFTKKIWQKVGGFDEMLSHNEDYAFAKALQKVYAKIVFKKDAIVYWQPRENFKQAFIMFFRFAYGDAEAEIYRPKVIFLFIRYALGIFLLTFAIMMKSVVMLLGLLILFVLYMIWATAKNYQYVKAWQALYLLPQIQLTTDWAVMIGTILGVLRKKITY